MRSCSLQLLGIAVVATLSLATGSVLGAEQREPHLGYLYPAGGCQDTISRITIGGQFLQGASRVHVSGTGVSASVVRYIKPLSQKQQGEVRRVLSYRRQVLQAEKAGKKVPQPPNDLPELPDHPWLGEVTALDGSALEELRMKLFNPKKQPNAQLAETVEIEVSISPDAEPGDREVRLESTLGLTNPLCFQVGEIPEVVESEAMPVLKLPVVCNGQILPGEVDRFRFQAKKGQKLCLDARARQLIPYLADAVPGWFQAILTVYDADGREVAYADDDYFNPDPKLMVEIPEDGEYTVEIRDSIYRGREDFVYRVQVGAFGEPTPVPDQIPQGKPEREPNNQFSNATLLRLPEWISGRVGEPGDVDFFRFRGQAGGNVVVEAFGRRHLNSPVDVLVKLVDDAGNTVAWNDDFMEKDGHLHLGPGLLTHHADAYLQTRLPRDGTYYVRVEDAQRHGGNAYDYRLRIGPPQPDFALRVTPSSLTIPANRTLPIDVYVLRKDGFQGSIYLALLDAPPGFILDGATIPAGKERIRMTLTAPADRIDEPVALQLEGRAKIGGQQVRRQAVPADNTMQAFLWRHLVPAHELAVSVRKPISFSGPILRAEDGRVRLRAGEEATVRLLVPNRPIPKNTEWELIDPPHGLSLAASTIRNGNLVLRLKVAEDGLEMGTRDNLIVGASLKRATGNGRKPARAISLGVLPAIPIEIVKSKG